MVTCEAACSILLPLRRVAYALLVDDRKLIIDEHKSLDHRLVGRDDDALLPFVSEHGSDPHELLPHAHWLIHERARAEAHVVALGQHLLERSGRAGNRRQRLGEARLAEDLLDLLAVRLPHVLGDAPVLARCRARREHRLARKLVGEAADDLAVEVADRVVHVDEDCFARRLWERPAGQKQRAQFSQLSVLIGQRLRFLSVLIGQLLLFGSQLVSKPLDLVHRIEHGLGIVIGTATQLLWWLLGHQVHKRLASDVNKARRGLALS